MKKQVLLSLCLAGAMSAMAQTDLVKEVEREIKSDATNYPAAIEKLQPAFSNPETANSAYPYFVAGKGGCEYFDKMQAIQQIGQPVDQKLMGHGLLDGTLSLLKVLPLDSVPDAKGKVKPKYSKDIIKLIKGHYMDLDNAARNLNEAGDFKGAYEAWELMLTLPTNKELGTNAPEALPDSTRGQIRFFQGIVAHQGHNNEASLQAFEDALALGYDKPDVYNYAISKASDLKDTGKMAKIANEAYQKFGDTQYINYIVNDKIQNKQYDEAKAMLDDLIAQNPGAANLYYVKGVILASIEHYDDSATALRKAIELDPQNAAYITLLGDVIKSQGVKLDESAPQGREYNQYFQDKIMPLFAEACTYYEKAIEIDPDNAKQNLQSLRQLYYVLSERDPKYKADYDRVCKALGISAE